MPASHPLTGQPLQQPSGMPIRRYTAYPRVDLPDRSWPAASLTRAPQWCAVDLRDGNQALAVPMDLARKRKLFELQVRMGFKEIEVGFPAASKTDFDFIRLLIEEDLIPDDVAIQVIMPAREELIHRTFESLAGAHRAIAHLYNSTSCLQREVVFGMDRAQIKDLAVRSTRLCKKLTEDLGIPGIRYEYTPESFTGTELDFALEISDAVAEVWDPSPDHKMILNLPATVEMSTPNIYADQIEWMHRHLDRRDSLILSIHPHNDRGTAVAAAELACMAGAERIEGCLFGNGERTGNVDLVTLGLNLFTQGVDPEIDYSDLAEVAATVEYCNRLPVHPRHPYGGELVHSAFSGSHQDAIKKGFEALEHRAAGTGTPLDQLPWAVPYLPIDPKDIGRDYEAVIRVNSQSGKAGSAYLLKTACHLDLPRPLQAEFARIIQEHTDGTEGELSADEVWSVFRRTYLEATRPLALLDHTAASSDDGATRSLTCTLLTGTGDTLTLDGTGTALADALLHGLATLAHPDTLDPTTLVLGELTQHPLPPDGDQAPRFAAYARLDHHQRSAWGAGVAPDATTATLQAVLSAVNRLSAESAGVSSAARC
ncbi:2-isopropylmalate synthase [Streptomyces sp. DSM 41528]|uniref:2-isopropylmalate synthase n=2 Tax=Streptomyces bugieae TaxID=3098223 RepID=A0ABU7NIN6_9ACTN|nr:2-isopropylmalate synthase [Streptomyces sp. DSM 41528]